MNNKPLPTIGVDKYTFFKVLTDTEEGTTYDTPYSLKGTVEISPTDNGGEDVFDADNGAYEIETYLENIGHEIENADIPPEVDALWRGLTLSDGAVLVSKVVTRTYFGVAWRILKSDGTYRYVKYFKGSYSFASNVGGKTKPSSGSAEKQTAKATFAAVHRESDDNIYMYVDQSDIESSEEYESLEEFEAAWFSDMNTLVK